MVDRPPQPRKGTGRLKAPKSMSDDERASILLGVFEEQDAEGKYVFRDQDVRHLIPAIALLSGWQPRECAAGTPLAQLMASFGEDLGLYPEKSKKEWEVAVATFYKKFPPHPELLKRLKSVLEGLPAT